MEDRTKEFWKNKRGQLQTTSDYVNGYLLKKLPDTQLLLAMDEVERVFNSPFRSDFFGMLRSWHNARSFSEEWRRFNIAFVNAIEPYDLIDDLNQSPFNVGNVIYLMDFTLQQVIDLNQRYENPISAKQVAKISELLGGHPYLTNYALYLFASQRIDFNGMVEHAYEDDGPFRHHLHKHLLRLNENQELKSGLMQVIKYHRWPNKEVFFRLRDAGLVKEKEDGSGVIPRNVLYAEYFGKRLND